jgi:cytochrome c
MKRITTVLFAAFGLAAASNALAMDELHKKWACTACHQDKTKLVGPAYQEVADKYRADYKKDAKGTIAKLSDKVKKGGMGVWGQIPMTPHGHVPDADIQKMVKAVLDMPPAKK